MMGFQRRLVISANDKEFEIWMEGYSCTGDRAGAKLLGVYSGETFKEAAIKFGDTEWGDDDMYWDSNRVSYWGCELYATEEEARKSFG